MNGIQFLPPLRIIVFFVALASCLSWSAAGNTPQSPVGSEGTRAVDECGTPGADWVFCCGFEEGNFDVWDDYDGNPEPDNMILENGGPST